MRQHTVFVIIVSVLSTSVSVAAFVAADIYLSYRAVRTPNPNAHLSNVHISDDLLGWRLKPGATGRHRETGSFDVTYHIDAQGFKAIDNHGWAAFRVYFFGDSYTFGHGVSNADTYATIIAREYLQDTIHVFNAGVMGYGIEQMYGRFLEIEKQLQPGDLVIFTPTSQDIRRNVKDFIFPAKLIFSGRFVQASRYPYYANGRLSSVELATPWRTFKALVFNGRWTKEIFRFVHRTVTPPDTTQEAREMLNTVRKRATQRGARFALFFLPQTKERRTSCYEEDVSQFDFYDVMDFFPADAETLRTIRFPTDSHWNRHGHAIAARAVVQTLVTNTLLRPSHLKEGGVKLLLKPRTQPASETRPDARQKTLGPE